MSLKWVDSREIALSLMEIYPEVDPTQLHFVELRNWVLELEEFEDDPDRCGERILEAIQLMWIDEM